MRLISQHDNSYILRLEQGEEFVSAIENFCNENKIHSAWLEALGSSKDLELAFYELEKRQYKTERFAGPMEILTITGNISKKENTAFCHAHGIFGRPDMTTLGGHINRCIISATCEVVLRVGDKELRREFDEETGLHLLG
ncbi:MAG: hypothetical protein A2919_02040 [Candidatus Spechtbacteria bacterium RIFCSPLOWO2_01_FULL_43_12]|uniref:PPC domain-containing protein n=1 Tax=Candidatus Spechtbacteria bacterium RIFCSPLOWO2_01_FULL_43_12 TaxID=1802162 RepID=A0A1G2HE35_9BACT|nr:MAG: hypothetical protein A2919_02040 [Candidatus Spechtbacteria bacterium RIFCSPLOWO2_01_FULL_43_12]